MSLNITVVPSVGSSDPLGHSVPPKATGSFQQPQSLTWGLPHFPVPLLPAPSIYFHSPGSLFPFQHLLYHPPNPPTSHREPPVGGLSLCDHHPALLSGEPLPAVNPQEGLGWTNSHSEGFQSPPQLWDLDSHFLAVTPAVLQVALQHLRSSFQGSLLQM